MQVDVIDLEIRLRRVEAERDELAHENERLRDLQHVLATLNSSLEIDDILSTVLRGVHDALGFGRVVLFDLVDARPRLRLEAEHNGRVTAPRTGKFEETHVLRELLETGREFHLGTAADGGSPMVPTRGPYALVPLVSRATVRGVLYVDAAPNGRITERDIATLNEFAVQAAIAIENADLLASTRLLAMTDALTGLYNRRAMQQMLERELHNAERYAAQLAVVMFDLDNLKRINDDHGHPAGDAALRHLSDVLKASSRKGDIVSRFGGDEFVVILTNTDKAAAVRGLERLFRTLGREAIPASAGAALFPADGKTAEDLISAADGALYHAKEAGKNTYRFAAAGADPAPSGSL
ncbi:MAG: GGDEF domain-containing protein [Candidatus Eremiobacteraeota bacterium]|nr:GGDEF domain-containing protein [Candidatus Eremiobacteraeota bacterium]